MGKKIPCGLSDADMLKDIVEEPISKTAIKPSKKESVEEAKDFRIVDMSGKLADRIGELLWKIKLEYYQEEIVDFSIEARKDGKNIVLVTKPKKEQHRI